MYCHWVGVYIYFFFLFRRFWTIYFPLWKSARLACKLQVVLYISDFISLSKGDYRLQIGSTWCFGGRKESTAISCSRFSFSRKIGSTDFLSCFSSNVDKILPEAICKPKAGSFKNQWEQGYCAVDCFQLLSMLGEYNGCVDFLLLTWGFE